MRKLLVRLEKQTSSLFKITMLPDFFAANRTLQMDYDVTTTVKSVECVRDDRYKSLENYRKYS